MKIYYHDKCHDGYSCVLLCKKVFPDATYEGYRYQDTVPKIDSGDIWFVDVALSQNQLDILLAQAIDRTRIVIIDHHPATGRLVCSDPRVKIYYHAEKSGGRLVWEYLYTHYNLRQQWCSFEKCPDIIRYTEDHDLWLFRQPMSYEVRYALQSLPWEKWGNYSIKDLMTQGVPLKRMVDKQVEAACSNAVERTIDGHRVLVCNSSVHHSEIGHRLSQDKPFAAIWNFTETHYKYSLRSRELDVSKIAEKFGGGGHKHAAGFALLSELQYVDNEG